MLDMKSKNPKRRAGLFFCFVAAVAVPFTADAEVSLRKLISAFNASTPVSLFLSRFCKTINLS